MGRRLAAVVLILPLCLSATGAERPPPMAVEADARSTQASPDQRPAPGTWLVEADAATRTITETITAREIRTGGEAIWWENLVLMVVIAGAVCGAGLLLVRSLQAKPERTEPAAPGTGTRFIIVPDERHRYSPAGTSIIARTTAFIRKGTGAFRKGGR